MRKEGAFRAQRFRAAVTSVNRNRFRRRMKVLETPCVGLTRSGVFDRWPRVLEPPKRRGALIAEPSVAAATAPRAALTWRPPWNPRSPFASPRVSISLATNRRARRRRVCNACARRRRCDLLPHPSLFDAAPAPLAQPTNDFAYWTTPALQEDRLGEQLAAIDIIQFRSLSALRDSIATVLDRFLENSDRLRTAPPIIRIRPCEAAGCRCAGGSATGRRPRTAARERSPAPSGSA